MIGRETNSELGREVSNTDLLVARQGTSGEPNDAKATARLPGFEGHAGHHMRDMVAAAGLILYLVFMIAALAVAHLVERLIRARVGPRVHRRS